MVWTPSRSPLHCLYGDEHFGTLHLTAASCGVCMFHGLRSVMRFASLCSWKSVVLEAAFPCIKQNLVSSKIWDAASDRCLLWGVSMF